ncbi:gamma-tubulin [Hanseniaspora vineae]
MTGEILTLQVGHCGNQLGKHFWSKILNEHAINKDGSSKIDNEDPEFTREDDPSVFLRQIEANKYTPRALLFDLEPSSINDTQNTLPGLFDERNVWISRDSLGAGNVWADGYDYGTQYIEDMINMIDKELDSTDNFEGFQLLHSVAGGTGSGLGSQLLEMLSDRYYKKLTTTYSVFPSTESDVVVQPYNTILTLRRLIENSDACIVFDNNSLMNLSSSVFRNSNTSFNDANQLIASVMSATTNSLRFPSYMYSSLSSIFSTIIPSPNLHFLIPSFTPFTTDFIPEAKNFKRKNSYDVILDLLDTKNSMFSGAQTPGYYEQQQASYIAIWDSLQGNVDQSDCMRALLKAQQRINYVPWGSKTINLNIGKKSKYNESGNSDCVTGLMLANSTGIKPIFNQSCKNFDALFKRNAFVTKFENGKLFEDGFDEFKVSREVVEDVIQEYTLCDNSSYLDDILLGDEDDMMVGIHDGMQI